MRSDPFLIFSYLAIKQKLNWLPDKLYLKLLYKAKTGKKLNLDSPITFNEKIQWLKLYDRNPDYTKLVDKFKVREFVAEKIGEQYLIPLLGVYENFDEINFNTLPNQFVLKCTHDSGGIVICKDKSQFDLIKARKKVNRSLKRNYYYTYREWPYRNIKPRIICERYMVDESKTELKDYKIFCFNGEPIMIQVDFNRFKNHKRNLYDINWNYLPFAIQQPTDPNKKIRKPEKLDEMLEIAKSLAEGFPHVRVDLYSVYDQIYFGEMTFYHGSGFEKFIPETYDKVLGDMLELPQKSFN